MPAETVNAPELEQLPDQKWSWRGVPRRHWYVLAGGVVALLIVGLAAWRVNEHWPYRYRNVKPMLEDVFASQITIGKYHRIYFPNPGFVADGVTLRRKTAPRLSPVGSIEHVRVEGRWTDLLTLRKRVKRVEADGLHVVIPPVGSEANHQDFPPGSAGDFTGPKTAVGELDIYNALLDIMRTDGRRYSFPIYRLVLGDVQQGRSVTFRLKMRNAIPAGDIVAHGNLGPLRADDLGQTPVSGDYAFTGVKLEDIPGLRGVLEAKGSFHGNLGGIEAETNGDVPDFAIGHGQARRLTGTARGAVDALNGNVMLHTVDLHTGRTDVHAEGTIAGKPKTTDLNITVRRGRAEDILQPFMHDRAPITGPVQLHTKARLAPAEEGRTFFQRLTMDGRFDIPAEKVTNPQTAKSMTAFSERAQGGREPAQDVGDDQPQAISSLVGDVIIRNGIAHAKALTFELPGAVSHLSGDFDLRNQNVKMTGDLQMQADVSHAATGFKSVLLKPFVAFFRKKHAGAVVPIAVSGAPHRYKVSQNVIKH
jgi:hypothetical protein